MLSLLVLTSLASAPAVSPGPMGSIGPMRALAAPDDPLRDVRVTARLDATPLEPGSSHRFELDLVLPEGLSNANPKIAPFLQIEVPDGVTLAGEVVDDYRALAANEFLHEPFERALTQLPATVEFQVDAAVESTTTLGLNLVAYLVDGDGEHYFLRRRLELPLAPKAEARPAADPRSHWGTDEALLQIGQRAAEFELPREDGSPVALTDYVGDKNIIVTTYRAFW